MPVSRRPNKPTRARSKANFRSCEHASRPMALCSPASGSLSTTATAAAVFYGPAWSGSEILSTRENIDRLYALAPDRFARKYAYQVVLLEEFQAAGVEVVFLHRPAGQSAEDELLLQVQGMLAEYERAKILERTRR